MESAVGSEPVQQVMLADCMAHLGTMADRSAELLLTDIPYGEVNRASNGLRKLDKSFADTLHFDHVQFARETARVSKTCYIFCGTEQVSDIRRSLVEGGMTTRVGVWQKSNPSPMNGQHVWLSGIELCVFGKHRGATFNGHCVNTVWKYPVPRRRNHPTPKPVDLLKFLIETSTNPGDTVIDPCVGGGSTAVAALLSGRGFVVCDNNPDCIAWTNEWLADIIKQPVQPASTARRSRGGRRPLARGSARAIGTGPLAKKNSSFAPPFLLRALPMRFPREYRR